MSSEIESDSFHAAWGAVDAALAEVRAHAEFSYASPAVTALDRALGRVRNLHTIEMEQSEESLRVIARLYVGREAEERAKATRPPSRADTLEEASQHLSRLAASFRDGAGRVRSIYAMPDALGMAAQVVRDLARLPPPAFGLGHPPSVTLEARVAMGAALDATATKPADPPFAPPHRVDAPMTWNGYPPNREVKGDHLLQVRTPPGSTVKGSIVRASWVIGPAYASWHVHGGRMAPSMARETYDYVGSATDAAEMPTA